VEKQETLENSRNDPQSAIALGHLLAERFSCRAFRPEPVPREIIQRVLELSQLSASWCNSQAWSVIVTEGEGTKRFAAALYRQALDNPGGRCPDFPMPDGYHGVYAERRRETGWRLYRSVGIAKGDRAASARQTIENFKLFGAPHALIITTDRDLGFYGAVDSGGYVANFMLVAQSFGIGTIAQGCLALHGPFMHEYFGLPEDRKVLCGISFGYPDRDHPANSFRTNRAPISEVATWVDS
jgi:nitroreductase